MPPLTHCLPKLHTQLPTRETLYISSLISKSSRSTYSVIYVLMLFPPLLHQGGTKTILQLWDTSKGEEVNIAELLVNEGMAVWANSSDPTTSPSQTEVTMKPECTMESSTANLTNTTREAEGNSCVIRSDLIGACKLTCTSLDFLKDCSLFCLLSLLPLNCF